MSVVSKTKIIYINESEYLKFCERRRFDNIRQKGHFYFDKIWSDLKIMTRDEAYIWLANKLNVPEDKAHFTYLSDEQCKEAIYYCQQLLNDARRLDLDYNCEPITPFYVLEE